MRRQVEGKHSLANRLFIAEGSADARDFMFGRGEYAERELGKSPKVVLLDLKLLKVNGLEVVRGNRMNEPTRILIVEDRPPDAELARREIRKSLDACVFECVETRANYLAALETFQPDLIISDYSLPHFDGMSALKLACERAPLTPVIIWTGSMNEDTAVECMKAGAVNYVIKENIKRLGPAVVHALEEKQVRVARQRAEEALRESGERFRALIEHSHDAITLLAADGTVLYDSPSVVRVLGYNPTERVGRSVFEFVHPEERQGMAEGFAKFVQQPGAVAPSRARFLHKDGTPRQIEGVRTNLLHEPAVRAVVVNYRDVTNRQRAEQALRESEERFSTIFRASPAGISVTRLADGQISDVNDAFLNIFGYTREEVIGRTTTELNVYVHPEDRGEMIERLADGSGIRKMERQFRKKSGEIGDLLVSAERIDLAGEKYVLSLMYDITERKRAEDEIRRRNQELATLNQIGQSLNRLAAPDEILETIFGMVGQVMDNRDLYIALYDEATRFISFPLYTMHGQRAKPSGRPFGNGITEYILRTNEPLLIKRDLSAALTERGIAVIGTPARSFLAVPLRSGDKVIGVLALQDYERENAYDEHALGLLTTIAAQAATAMENARLFAATTEQAQHQRALYDISTTLARIHDAQEVCAVVVAAAREILHYPFVGIFLIEPQTGDRVLQAQSGWENVPQNWRHRSGQGLSENALLTGKLQYTPDVTREPKYVAGRSDTRSEVDVPIKIGDTALGVLVAEDPRVDAFDTEDCNILQAVANQLALALERARLFEEQRASLAMTTRLYELSANVLAATTVEETARLVTETVRDGFAADACTIHLFNESDAAAFRLSVGFSPNFHEEARERLHGLTARARESKEPIIAMGDELNPRVRAEGIQTNIALPLPGEKENIGVLFVGYRQPRLFGARERNTMSLFANHAALALRRARLFRQAQQRLTELEAVNRISTALRSATTLDEMLPRLLDETLRLLNTDTGFLSLYDRENDEFRRSAARGWAAELPRMPLRANEGIVGYVCATGETYLSRDFVGDPRTRGASRALIRPGWGGACVPIRTTDEVIGVIMVTVPLPREISTEEAHLLTTLAEIGGNAIQRARLHSQTEQNLQRITALRAIDNAINASLDLRVTANVVLGQIVAQLGVDAAAVLRLNPHTQTLEHVASRGFRNPRLEKMSPRLGEGLAGRVAMERRTRFSTDLPAEDMSSARATALANDGFATCCSTPLIAKGAVKGVLEIFHRTPLAPSAEWVDFLEALGGQVAIAIDNAELFDTLQHTNSELVMAYDDTIEGWSRALDLRDHETEGHTQRVTELALRLARVVGVDETGLIHIRRGALLHDIGKVGIPDSILLKPTALTTTEWEVMRQHPVYARDLLAPIAYLRPAIDIPYCHHERWDGTGYPRGLREEEIPLGARVFALIDVWDALSSNRPYRPAWTAENVREHIRAQSGMHFDPHVVQVFLEMIERQ